MFAIFGSPPPAPRALARRGAWGGGPRAPWWNPAGWRARAILGVGEPPYPPGLEPTRAGYGSPTASYGFQRLPTGSNGFQRVPTGYNGFQRVHTAVSTQGDPPPRNQRALPTLRSMVPETPRSCLPRRVSPGPKRLNPGGRARGPTCAVVNPTRQTASLPPPSGYYPYLPPRHPAPTRRGFSPHRQGTGSKCTPQFHQGDARSLPGSPSRPALPRAGHGASPPAVL